MSGDNPLEGLNILVAEDESLIAFDLTAMLTRFGCHVVGPAARIEDVIRLARAGQIDGALLDVNLRGRQIFDILPELLALDLKVVLTSGYDDATLFPPAFRGLPRISKPVDEKALREACQTHFAR